MLDCLEHIYSQVHPTCHDQVNDNSTSPDQVQYIAVICACACVQNSLLASYMDSVFVRARFVYNEILKSYRAHASIGTDKYNTASLVELICGTADSLFMDVGMNLVA